MLFGDAAEFRERVDRRGVGKTFADPLALVGFTSNCSQTKHMKAQAKEQECMTLGVCAARTDVPAALYVDEPNSIFRNRTATG